MLKAIFLAGVISVVLAVIAMILIAYCVQAWADFIWPFGRKK